MDGIELARRIRAQHPQLPMILLSSVGDERRKQQSELFASVLTKPVRQNILYNHLLSELKQQNRPKVEEADKERKLSEAFAQQYPLSILIAEDNLVNQKLAVRILHKLGYQPTVAGNGQAVLTALSSRAYEIILMDVQMPEMDGLEATREIRAGKSVQPVIIANDSQCHAGRSGRVSKGGYE